MNTRKFSSSEGFTSYSETDKTNGARHTSPFPVAVLGKNHEFLGIGVLIGAVLEGTIPVISVQDPKAEGGAVELLGTECFRTQSIDEHKLKQLSSAAMGGIVPASEYVARLDNDG